MKQLIKISQVKNNPNNPRVIKDHDFYVLVNSIKTTPGFMEFRPVIIDYNNMVLCGNQRLRACIYLGHKEIWTDLFTQEKADEMNKEAQKEGRPTKTYLEYCKAITIVDNTHAGTWDWDILANEWEQTELENWGLNGFPFEDKTLKAEEDNFKVPDEIKTDIVLGDLFEIGEHRLLCGDSTDSDQVAKLMNGKKADMVFTSPPYNGNTVAGFEKDGGKTGLKSQSLYINNETDNKTAEEYIQFNEDIFNTIKTIASDDLVILYNINYNRNSPDDYIDVVNQGRNIFNLVETIIWEKSMAISLAGDNLTRIIEFIFVFYNGNDKPKLNKTHTNECIKNLWSISNIGANHETHKACFPIKLVEQGINVYAKENALLYEPFTGSGTTMVAAHQLNRKCYGMELDPKYCQVIIDRMKKLDPNLVIKRNGINIE
jgi:DNA modification methylase